MQVERHTRLKELFFASIGLDAGERVSFLQGACSGDPAMVEEVLSLVELEQQVDPSFLHDSTVVVLDAMDEIDPATGEQDEEPIPLPLASWDRYSILGRIGSGGMADVYKAFDPRLNRHVALKFIRTAHARQLQRFLREAKAQARLSHDNILEVYETGEVEDLHYIAMRYIDGPTLIETRADTTLEQKVTLLIQVAEAIHAAHRQGLIHRDIKPANILVDTTLDGELKPYVMDFGIAAQLQEPGLTATGEMLGTPWYMAPEQVRVREHVTDRRTDVYSLGVTMFELLSGRRPYAADSAVEMLGMLCQNEPMALRQVQHDLPAELETIVMKCLEKDMQRRYPSARALAEDLRRFLDGEPVLARRPSMWYRLLKKVRRHKAIVVVSSAALVSLALMAGLNLEVRQQARVREELARDFSRRVNEIESVMRMASIAPLHDVTEERQQVRELMGQIRVRLEQSELLGEGSGHYALGRGYLALGEHVRAREHLERAWARGYRGPGVACVLGRVLAELSLLELSKAMQIPDPDLRAERLAEIDGEYQQPALSYLRIGKGAREEAPEYVDALLAFLEHRVPAAIASAQAGYQRLSWLYEAIRLEADLTADLGFDSWYDGHVSEAVSFWETSADIYDRAAAVARSDARVSLALCRLMGAVATMVPDEQLLALSEPLAQGTLACSNSLSAEPDLAVAMAARARLLLGDARLARHREQDPGPVVGDAMAMARQASMLRPTDPVVALTLAQATLASTRLEEVASSSWRELLEQAITAYETASRLDPKAVEAVNLEALREIARSGPVMSSSFSDTSSGMLTTSNGEVGEVRREVKEFVVATSATRLTPRNLG